MSMVLDEMYSSETTFDSPTRKQDMELASLTPIVQGKHCQALVKRRACRLRLCQRLAGNSLRISARSGRRRALKWVRTEAGAAGTQWFRAQVMSLEPNCIASAWILKFVSCFSECSFWANLSGPAWKIRISESAPAVHVCIRIGIAIQSRSHYDYGTHSKLCACNSAVSLGYGI